MTRMILTSALLTLSSLAHAALDTRGVRIDEQWYVQSLQTAKVVPHFEGPSDALADSFREPLAIFDESVPRLLALKLSALLEKEPLLGGILRQALLMMTWDVAGHATFEPVTGAESPAAPTGRVLVIARRIKRTVYVRDGVLERMSAPQQAALVLQQALLATLNPRAIALQSDKELYEQDPAGANAVLAILLPQDWAARLDDQRNVAVLDRYFLNRDVDAAYVSKDGTKAFTTSIWRESRVSGGAGWVGLSFPGLGQDWNQGLEGLIGRYCQNVSGANSVGLDELSSPSAAYTPKWQGYRSFEGREEFQLRWSGVHITSTIYERRANVRKIDTAFSSVAACRQVFRRYRDLPAWAGESLAEFGVRFERDFR